jgi:hypothetical protein
MNPQLTNAIAQTRRQELHHAAQSARMARMARGTTHRRNPLTQLLRHVPAPRLSLRLTGRAGVNPNALNQL